MTPGLLSQAVCEEEGSAPSLTWLLDYKHSEFLVQPLCGGSGSMSCPHC